MEIKNDILTLWELVKKRPAGEVVLIEMGGESMGVFRVTKEFEQKMREAKK